MEGATDVQSATPIRRMSAGRLCQIGINFQVPANEGAKKYIKDTHGHESWRLKILRFLHNHKVQYALMALLFLDVVILFIETFLVGHYPACEIIERDCLSCCPTSVDNANRFLSGDADEPICESGYDTTVGYGSCDESKWHTVHTIEIVLFFLTITILFTFLLEINLEVVALGPNVFFRQVWYSLDYIIITVSTTLELLFYLDNEDLGLSTISGLIIFARIWRFVRIGHGIIEVTTELTHKRYEDLLEYAEKLEAEMKKNELPLPKPPKSLREEEDSA